MRRRNPYDVAVVGAGMVGAALALRLARAGFDVAVVEPREPAAWSAHDEVDLRVVALAPSSAHLLAAVDAWDAIRRSRACAYRNMRVWDALAPGELHFDAARQGEATLGWIVENRLIQHTLWQRAQAEPGLSVRCPARVASTRHDERSRTLDLDDGTSLSARLVVAADGADSTLREMAGIVARGRDYAQRAIVAHVRTQRAHEHTAWQRFLPGATLAFLPLADGRSSVVWSLPEADAAALLELTDDAFCMRLGAAFDLRLGRIESSTPRAAFPLRLRIARRYLAPRLALIGDAAHVVHPLAGQGVNLGLRDVAELADVLIAARDADRDFAAESTLRRFERRRRSDNALSANMFDAIQRVFGSESMALARLRGAALGAIDRLPPLKHLLAAHAAGR